MKSILFLIGAASECQKDGGAILDQCKADGLDACCFGLIEFMDHDECVERQFETDPILRGDYFNIIKDNGSHKCVKQLTPCSVGKYAELDVACDEGNVEMSCCNMAVDTMVAGKCGQKFPSEFAYDKYNILFKNLERACGQMMTDDPSNPGWSQVTKSFIAEIAASDPEVAAKMAIAEAEKNAKEALDLLINAVSLGLAAALALFI